MSTQKYIRNIIFIITLFYFSNGLSDENRYIITKSNKVNIRTGPDFRYIVKYIYIKKNTVLKIKNTFEDWYLVQDLEGDEGWAYKNMISMSKKIHLVSIKSKSDIICYKKPTINSKISFKASYLSTFKLKTCDHDFCLLEKDRISGWCQKNSLWGI